MTEMLQADERKAEEAEKGRKTWAENETGEDRKGREGRVKEVAGKG